MMYADSNFAFMDAAVHITIYYKIHAAHFIHADNTDVMLSIVFSLVHALISNKTKYTRQLIACLIIRPKLSSLYKTDNISFFIGSKFYVFIPYSQLNQVIIYLQIFRPENLFHRTLVIQKIHSVLCITYTVIFFYIIVFQLAVCPL